MQCIKGCSCFINHIKPPIEIWMQGWELNPFISAYEADKIPYLPPAINGVGCWTRTNDLLVVSQTFSSSELIRQTIGKKSPRHIHFVVM